MKRQNRRDGRFPVHATPAGEADHRSTAPRQPFSPFRRGSAAPRSTAPRSLGIFEPLEPRRLMAGMSLSNGLLHVYGDDGRGNDLQVRFDGGNKGTLVASANGQFKSYPTGSVQKIRIDGGDRGDYINVANDVPIAAELYGHSGDDQVSGGLGRETIRGGNGRDTLDGNGGDDAIFGESDNDTLIGGDGNDSLDGGGGGDDLHGRAGHDIGASGYWRSGMEGVWNNPGGSPAPAPATPATPATGEGVSLQNGVLKIVGDADAENDLVLKYHTVEKTFTGFANGNAKTYGKTSVKSAEIVGGSKDDNIFVDDDVPLNTTLKGGEGNDDIHGGPMSDVIYAGGGNDDVEANGGNDKVFGEGGNDTIDGGSGYNELDGGSGYDVAKNGVFKGGIEATLGAPAPTPAPAPKPAPAPSNPVPSNSGPGSPVARITNTTGLTINAGQSIHAHALDSTLNGGSPITARYEWDFGDGGGEYNKLVGFNAAHTYHKPGTYNLTLRVFNEGRKSSTVTKTVTVQGENRQEIYVSASGNDSNPGTWDKPIRSWGRAGDLMDKGRSDTRVLFRRGDTFDATESLVLTGRNVELGAFGSGNRPVIKWVGSKDANSIVRTHTDVDGATIHDLTFDSKWNETDGNATGMPFAIGVLGRNVTIRDNTFLNVGYAVQLNGKPERVLVQDNESPLATGLRGYFSWVSGKDMVFLGNKVANSTREHTMRISNGERVLLHDNDLSNLNRTSSDKYDTAKGVVTVQKGQYAYLSSNDISGPLPIGPLGEKDGLPEKGSRFKYAVVEGNRINREPLEVAHGAEHVMIRNNVFRVSDDYTIEVDGFNGEYGRGVVDVTIANNTGINTATRGTFVWFGGSPNGATLVNNLYVADNLVTGAYFAAPVYVNASSLNGFNDVGHNVWPVPTILNWAAGGINYVGVNVGSAGYQTPAEWDKWPHVANETFDDTKLDGSLKPVGGEPAVDAAVAVDGVFTDMYGKFRDPSKPWSAGAVQA